MSSPPCSPLSACTVKKYTVQRLYYYRYRTTATTLCNCGSRITPHVLSRIALLHIPDCRNTLTIAIYTRLYPLVHPILQPLVSMRVFGKKVLHSCGRLSAGAYPTLPARGLAFYVPKVR